MSGEMAGAEGAAPPPMSARCPACGAETEIERAIEPGLVSLGRDELETLVRSEWRRRTGEAGYGRSHSRSLVRALIDFALDPEDSALGDAVEDLLWVEVALLQTWGLSRARMSEELLRLSQAMWDVLSWTDLDLERSQALMRHMDAKIFRTLPWPEPISPGESGWRRKDTESKGGAR